MGRALFIEFAISHMEEADAATAIRAAVGGIAVVIPLYNKAPWIKQTLESVLNQVRTPDEIIVVDDGSTDEGPLIVEAVGGDRVRLIRTERPQSGPSAARNLGIRAAQCEWIALLDADDLWSPEYLSNVTGCIQAEPNVGCVFSSLTMLGKDAAYQHHPQFPGNPRRLDLGTYLELWIEVGRRGGAPMTSSSSVIRKSVLENAGLFPERFRRGEDKDTWLRVLAAADAIYLPEPLVGYRRDLPGQLSDEPVDGPPPVVFTAAHLSRSPTLPPKLRGNLRRLANRELWLYAKRQRLRPLDKAALRAFDVRQDPFRFLMLIALYGAGVIRNMRRRRAPVDR